MTQASILVERITRTDHQLQTILIIGITLSILTLCVELSEREKLHPSGISQTIVRRLPPIRSLAQSHRSERRKRETVHTAAVIFPEQTEVTISAERTVHDTSVHKLQRTGRINPRPVSLELRLTETDTPRTVRLIVNNTVLHDICSPVRCRLRITAGKT